MLFNQPSQPFQIFIPIFFRIVIGKANRKTGSCDEESIESFNQRNSMKMIMEYYENNDMVSGSIDDDLNSHLILFIYL